MSSQEDRIIDLSQNQLLARFFEGWDPRKAHEFAQNLLLIGVGVAYKMLNENAPEQAFEKIQKMAQNVVKDYSEIEDFKQTYQVNQINKGSSFNSRQNRQPEMGNNGTEEQIQKEIFKVQQKLQKLTQRLEQESKEISFENKSSQIPSKRKYLQSPVTQKITQIPPPQHRFTSPGRQTQSLSQSRHHLNDEAIKECMNNPWDTENEEVGFVQSDNFQFPQIRDSSVNRSSERFSDTYFSTGFNFLNQNKHLHQPSKQEQVQNKKKKEENYQKRKADKKNQQQFRSNSPKQYKSVESRIKSNILANREQHPQNQDSDRTRDPYDFKQMMIQENRPSNNQNQMQIPPEQQGKKDKNDIVNEMGVVFSKEAQRKFYEKKDKEMKLLEQQKRYSSDQLLQMQVRKQGNLQKMQQQKQDFTYPGQNIEGNFLAQGYYAQQPQNQVYQMERMRDNQLNSSTDGTRENPNNQQQYRTQYYDQPLPDNNKNILEIANEFLSSPFMRQFDEEEDGSRQQHNLEELSQPQNQDSSQQQEYQDQRIQNTGSQYLNYQQQYPLSANYSNFQSGRSNNQLASSQETTQNNFYSSDAAATQQPQQLQFPSFNPNKAGIEGEYDEKIGIQQQQFNARHSGYQVPSMEEGRNNLSEQHQVQQFQRLRQSNYVAQNPLQQQQGQISNAKDSLVLYKQKEVQFQR